MKGGGTQLRGRKFLAPHALNKQWQDVVVELMCLFDSI